MAPTATLTSGSPNTIRRGRGAPAHRLCQPAGGCRGPTGLRQHEDFAGQTLTRLRVVFIDDTSRCRVKPAPEAERLVQRQHWCLRSTGMKHIAFDEMSAHADPPFTRHNDASVQTSPRTADSMHSSRLPNRTSISIIPGA